MLNLHIGEANFSCNSVIDYDCKTLQNIYPLNDEKNLQIHANTLFSLCHLLYLIFLFVNSHSLMLRNVFRHRWFKNITCQNPSYYKAMWVEWTFLFHKTHQESDSLCLQAVP